MFVHNAVVKEFEGELRYDKLSIAATMFDVIFRGATCSVIESQVLKDCSAYEIFGDFQNLKYDL